MDEDKRAILRTIPFFQEVSDQDLVKINEILREHHYLNSDIIIREGTLADSFCIIETGKVEITKRFETGDEMVIDVLSQGDFFGEMALLNEGLRSATARAIENTTILKISRKDFESLFEREPYLALIMTKELSKRLRQTNQMMVKHLERKNKELSLAYLNTVNAVVNALEARDNYTRGHTDRVTAYSKTIAQALDFDESDLFNLEIGALLHDVGKIGIPDAILNKPSKLTEEEFNKIKEHPLVGQQIIRDIPFLKDAASCILCHHERFDGKGYPHGLSGENIPINGRIIALTDAFDAMTSDRPYRAKMDSRKAINELQSGKGSQFDPSIVDVFFSAFLGEKAPSIE